MNIMINHLKLSSMLCIIQYVSKIDIWSRLDGTGRFYLAMAYRYGQNYESSVHNIKGIIETSKVDTIYQSSTKYIKLGNLISKCAHKISTTVTRSSNMKRSGSNQSENCRSCNFLRRNSRKSGDVSFCFCFGGKAVFNYSYILDEVRSGKGIVMIKGVVLWPEIIYLTSFRPLDL